MKAYYPMTLHVHSIWERQASMEGHFYNAQKLGIHHMYITDHDNRMGPRANHVDHFDFTKGVLKVLEPSKDPLRPRWYGFTVVQQDEGTSVTMKDGAMHLEASSTEVGKGKWSTINVLFDSSQKRHEVALLAKAMLHLGMQITDYSDCSKDIRIIIDVKLSQRPPEFENAHIYYVFGNTEGLETPYITVKSMDEYQAFNCYAFDLLTDAEPVGGADNILNTVSFIVSARNGRSAKMSVDHMSFSWELEFEEGRKEQQRVADEIGKKYGVTTFVTSEISAAGPHKICFSTKVPIINYKERNYQITDEEAMEHVRSHGGIYSRNHPFFSIKDKVKLGERPEIIEQAKQEIIRKYVENRVWGAAMIEIGFPAGRHGASLEDYLYLWDRLSSEGIFISGYGDSDSHGNHGGWFDGNNFVGYIAAENPCEEEFIHSMKAGDLYTGDPVYLQRVEVSFVSSEGQMMGQVSVNEKPGKAILTLKDLPEDCRVIWTANGQNIRTDYCGKEYQGTLDIPTEEKVNFVRVALYKGERCIMLTNPIYQTLDEEVMKNISEERKYEYV